MGKCPCGLDLSICKKYLAPFTSGTTLKDKKPRRMDGGICSNCGHKKECHSK